MKKTIISIFLIGAMVLSATACSFGSKFNEKKMVEFFEKKLDAEEEDYDDVYDSLDEGDFEEFTDGLYFKADKKQMKEFTKGMEFSDYLGKTSKVTESINYFLVSQKNMSVAYIALWTFESKDDATDFLDNTAEAWEDTREDYEDWAIADEEETEILAWFDEGKYGGVTYVGAYQDSNKVLVYLSMEDEDTIEDLCDYFKLDCATEIE